MQAKLEKQRIFNNVSYRRYSIKDVEGATNGFSDALKIGEGGYGPVYKAVLDYTSVAIKILKSGITQGLKQFQQEVVCYNVKSLCCFFLFFFLLTNTYVSSLD